MKYSLLCFSKKRVSTGLLVAEWGFRPRESLSIPKNSESYILVMGRWASLGEP